MEIQRSSQGLKPWKSVILRRREEHPDETYEKLARFMKTEYGLEREYALARVVVSRSSSRLIEDKHISAI